MERAERAGAPPDAHDARVLDLDVARERGRVGLHALDRPDEPVEQVDVVARLVHERAAVELPRAAPRRAVVVRLRARPEHVHVHHVDAAEAALLHGALHELQRGVPAVLLHDEEKDAGLVADAHHLLAVLPARGHRLLGDHVTSVTRAADGLRGVQPARRGEDHRVGVALLEQLVERVERGGARLRRGGVGARRVDVAHRHELGPFGVSRDGLHVVRGDAPAADEREADATVGDERLVPEQRVGHGRAVG